MKKFLAARTTAASGNRAGIGTATARMLERRYFKMCSLAVTRLVDSLSRDSERYPWLKVAAVSSLNPGVQATLMGAEGDADLPGDLMDVLRTEHRLRRNDDDLGDSPLAIRLAIEASLFVGRRYAFDGGCRGGFDYSDFRWIGVLHDSRCDWTDSDGPGSESQTYVEFRESVIALHTHLAGIFAIPSMRESIGCDPGAIDPGRNMAGGDQLWFRELCRYFKPHIQNPYRLPHIQGIGIVQDAFTATATVLESLAARAGSAPPAKAAKARKGVGHPPLTGDAEKNRIRIVKAWFVAKKQDSSMRDFCLREDIGILPETLNTYLDWYRKREARKSDPDKPPSSTK